MWGSIIGSVAGVVVGTVLAVAIPGVGTAAGIAIASAGLTLGATTGTAVDQKIAMDEAKDQANESANKQELYAQKQAENNIRRAVAAGGTDNLFNIKLKEGFRKKTVNVAQHDEPATNRAALSHVRKAFTFNGLRTERTRGSPVTVS